MKKLIIYVVVLLSLSGALALAADKPDSDADPSIGGSLTQIWNFIYYRYGLSGYPVYNAKLSRYDFFDLNNSYTGSLFFNPLTEKWECYKL